MACVREIAYLPSLQIYIPVPAATILVSHVGGRSPEEGLRPLSAASQGPHRDLQAGSEVHSSWNLKLALR